VARLSKARIQAAALVSVWVQTILIRSHTLNYIRFKARVEHLFWAKAAKAARFISPLKLVGFRA